MKGKVLILFILFSFYLGFLDRIIFGWLSFKIPNHLEWDTSPWYNFLDKNKSTHFSKNESGVLIVGSSVALYSALPSQIQKNLQDHKFLTKVEFFSHVALTPTDFYYYVDDILKKDPKIILYLLNPADFQFDYLKKQGKTQELVYSETESFEHFKTRSPVRYIYPTSFLLNHWNQLNWKEFVSFLSSSLFLVNRYNSFLMDPIEAWIERIIRSGRSYHYYTGKVPREGIFNRGWTKDSFSIDCEIQNNKFEEDFFIQKPKTKVSIYEDNVLIYENMFLKKSWYDVQFSLPKKRLNNKFSLKFKISPSVNSKEVDDANLGFVEKYGIRLSQNFCKKHLETDISYDRKKSLEDDRILEMTIPEYLDDYHQRLYENVGERKELTRLKLISDTKKLLNLEKNFFIWSEFEKLQEVVKFVKKTKSKLIIVNNPENPIELEKYKNSNWYGGYLKFLKNLESNHVIFYDRKEFLKDPRYFLDPHHLNYQGAELISKEYSNFIINALGRSAHSE